MTVLKNQVAHYVSRINEGAVYFEIPVSDMATTSFFPEMDGKLLIRWITEFKPV
jgi:hypothetical protein